MFSVAEYILLCIPLTFLDIRDIMCKLYTAYRSCVVLWRLGGSPTDELR